MDVLGTKGNGRVCVEERMGLRIRESPLSGPQFYSYPLIANLTLFHFIPIPTNLTFVISPSSRVISISALISALSLYSLLSLYLLLSHFLFINLFSSISSSFAYYFLLPFYFHLLLSYFFHIII